MAKRPNGLSVHYSAGIKTYHLHNLGTACLRKVTSPKLYPARRVPPAYAYLYLLVLYVYARVNLRLFGAVRCTPCLHWLLIARLFTRCPPDPPPSSGHHNRHHRHRCRFLPVCRKDVWCCSASHLVPSGRSRRLGLRHWPTSAARFLVG